MRAASTSTPGATARGGLWIQRTKPPTHIVGAGQVVGGGDGTIVGGTGKYAKWTGTYTDRVFVELNFSGGANYDISCSSVFTGPRRSRRYEGAARRLVPRRATAPDHETRGLVGVPLLPATAVEPRSSEWPAARRGQCEIGRPPGRPTERPCSSVRICCCAPRYSRGQLLRGVLPLLAPRRSGRASRTSSPSSRCPVRSSSRSRRPGRRRVGSTRSSRSAAQR